MVSGALVNLLAWAPYIAGAAALFVLLNMFTNWLSK